MVIYRPILTDPIETPVVHIDWDVLVHQALDLNTESGEDVLEAGGWGVVESIPSHHDIQRGLPGDRFE